MCSDSKRRLISVMLTAMAFIMFFLTGCAGSSQDVIDEHELSDEEFRQKFIEDRDRCQSRGRTIVINGDGARLDRHGVPRARVNYYCTRVKTF